MKSLSAIHLLALLAAATPCVAQVDTTQTTSTDSVRLTPEQREAALEAGAQRSASLLESGTGTDRRIHGEAGVEVGSRGERAMYGTAVVPVGQNGVAAVSYGIGRGPRWYRTGRRPDHAPVSIAPASADDGQP